MKNPHNLAVGQELYFVNADKRWGARDRFCKIIAIGKKWAAMEGGARCNIQSLYADGGGYTSPGRYHLSKEAYDESVAVETAWRIIRREFDWNAPPITIEEMRQVAAILKVKI